MAKSKMSVVTLTTKLILVNFSRLQGSNLLPDGAITIGSTSSLTYTPLHTELVTVEKEGTISIADVFVEMNTVNDINAECKLQISGDGEATPFVDITGDIGSGTVSTGGSGLWIGSIDIGEDKLRLRMLGRSTDGFVATIKGDLSVYLTIHKSMII